MSNIVETSHHEISQSLRSYRNDKTKPSFLRRQESKKMKNKITQKIKKHCHSERSEESLQMLQLRSV